MNRASLLALLIFAAACLSGIAGAAAARYWRRQTEYRASVLIIFVSASGFLLAASAPALPLALAAVLAELWFGFAAGVSFYLRSRWQRQIGVGELGTVEAERSGLAGWVRDRREPAWRTALQSLAASSLVDRSGPRAVLGPEIARADGRPMGAIVGVRLGQMVPGPGGNSGVVGLILGRPESGKTTTAVRLLHATAAADPEGSIVIVDPKGDRALRAAAQEIAARHGTSFWEWSRESPLDPLTCAGAGMEFAVQSCVARVMASQTYSDQYYEAVSMEAYTDAAELLLMADRALTLDSLAGALTPSGAQRLLEDARRGVLTGSVDAAAFEVAAARNADTDPKRWAVLNGAGARLAVLARSGLGVRFTAAQRGGRTIGDLASTPGVAYLHLQAGMWPDTAVHVAELLTVGLMQDLGTVAETGEHTATLFVDEAGAVPAARLDALLQRGRSAGFSVYLAAQTLAGIGATEPALVAQITGTLSWVVAHASLGQAQAGEDDAERIARLAGTRTEHERTTQTTGGSLALPTGMGSERQVESYAAHPNLIRSLPKGRAVVVDVAAPTTGRSRARLCAVQPYPPQLHDGGSAVEVDLAKQAA